MQLERIQVRLRHRSGWEALDLGREMVRAWAGPVYRAWAATYVPLALLLGVVCWPWPELAPLLLWWLKPLFDRVLLHVYSGLVFGQPSSVADVWRALPRLCRHTRLASSLTWRRLSPARSFLLPIWQLEGQASGAARSRGRVLGNSAWGYAGWLTLACGLLSLTITASLVLLTDWLWPVGGDGFFSMEDLVNGDLDPWVLVTVGMFAALADSIVEPQYVASGFSLYLNRRAELEGWDIELAFRLLASRRRGHPARLVRTAAASVLAAILLTHSGHEAWAMSNQPAGGAPITPAPAPPKRVIAEVLADPVFGEVKQAIEWRWRERPAAHTDLPWWLQPIGRLVELVARGGRALAWAAGAALLGFVLWRLAGQRRETSRRARKAEVPEILFGLDVRPESLPDDIAGAARELVGRGELTAALSLLYRGALVALIHRGGVEFLAGDTERDCLRRAESRLASKALAYFGTLIQAWQLAAYAQQAPAAGHVLHLADGWIEHFGARGGAA
jgi:hypothetical protein